MKSPTLQTVVIAVVFAMSSLTLSLLPYPLMLYLVAGLVFISAFIAPLVGGKTSNKF